MSTETYVNKARAELNELLKLPDFEAQFLEEDNFWQDIQFAAEKAMEGISDAELISVLAEAPSLLDFSEDGGCDLRETIAFAVRLHVIEVLTKEFEEKYQPAWLEHDTAPKP